MGQTAGEQSLILKQLTRKLGNLPIELTAKINNLSLERLEALGEALLDFEEIGDLIMWLDENR
jgi:heme oxygenase